MTNLDKNTLTVLLEQGLLSKEQYNLLINSDEPQKTSAEDHLSVKKVFTEFVLKMKAKGLSKNTIDGYSINTKKFLAYIIDKEELDATPMPAIEKASVEEWLNKFVSDGYTDTSIRRFKNSLKSFFEFLAINYNMITPDVKKIEVQAAMDDEDGSKNIFIPTDDEVRAIANCAVTKRDQCIILIAYEAGLRRQELVDLKKENVDLNDHIVKIYNGHQLDRVGVISEGTAKLLREYLEDWESQVVEINLKRKTNFTTKHSTYVELKISEYMFQTIRSPQISYSTYFKAVKDASFEYYSNFYKSTGMTSVEARNIAEEKSSKINTETLRQARRAFLFSEGKTIEQVQAIMGDENRWVCRRYLKLSQQLYPHKFA